LHVLVLWKKVDTTSTQANGHCTSCISRDHPVDLPVFVFLLLAYSEFKQA
jgi:hypothetical protein